MESFDAIMIRGVVSRFVGGFIFWNIHFCAFGITKMALAFGRIESMHRPLRKILAIVANYVEQEFLGSVEEVETVQDVHGLYVFYQVVEGKQR